MKQWFWKYWKRNSTGLWPLKGGKQRKVTPATKSAYFLEAVSRLWHSHTTACSLPEWKRGRLELREAMNARTCRRVTEKRELHWNLKKGPFKSWPSANPHIHEKKPPRAGEESWESSFWNSRPAGNSSYSFQPEWKDLCMQRTSDRVGLTNTAHRPSPAHRLVFEQLVNQEWFYIFKGL